MLRHSAGNALSNKRHDFPLLQDFMGQRSTPYVTLHANGQPAVRRAVEVGRFRFDSGKVGSTRQFPGINPSIDITELRRAMNVQARWVPPCADQLLP
jgi:hypothetical protein